MASGKAVDAVYKVQIPPAARKIREMYNNIFYVEDHFIHFYYLGGPDFVVGPTAPKAERNILGVIGKVGLEIAGKVIAMRRELREILQKLGGKVIHPVFNLPGGISKPLDPEYRKHIVEVGKKAVDFSLFSLKIFDDIVLKNKQYVDIILSEPYTLKTNYMGLVDENNHPNYYDGMVRVVDPDGKEIVKFHPNDYLKYVGEHIETWSYLKFPFLRNIGWKGFVDGPGTSIYRVAPLARLNVADGMSTPLAQEHFEKMFSVLGKPAHNTLAWHWARLIEALNASEMFLKIAQDESICDPNVRTIPTETPDEGIGIVEAPRGTLIHHYKTDKRGVVEWINLIVATAHNNSAMQMGVERAAKAVIKNGKYDYGILNLIEIVYRAYDPCHACGTHFLPGDMPLEVVIKNPDGEIVASLKK